MLHEVIHGNLGVIHQGKTAIDDFVEVMRRNVGCHTDGNTGGTIDEQIGHARWENIGNEFSAVIIFREIHCLLVQVGQELMGNLVHAYFRVSHGRRRITVY